MSITKLKPAAIFTVTEPGFYRTRTGRRARVLCLDAPGEYPCAGYIEGARSVITAKQWKQSGLGQVNIDDLVEPWRDNRTITLDLYIMLDVNGAAIVSYNPPREGDGYIGVKKLSVTVNEGDSLDA